MMAKDAATNEAVLNYLNAQNRPYSAIDIFNNLHKAHGQTAIKKSLQSLTSDGKIIEKTYGKQSIYYINQSQFPLTNDEELKNMDKKISDLTQSSGALQKELTSMDYELTRLSNSLTLEGARARLDEITNKVSAGQKSLDSIKDRSDSIDSKEKDHIFASRQKYIGEWRKRKRMATDVLDTILENYPKSKKDFMEEVGCETDEDYGVAIPRP